MGEPLQTTSSAPGLQLASIDLSSATADLNPGNLAAIQEEAQALASEFNLAPEQAEQISEILSKLPESSHPLVREALTHKDLDTTSTTEFIESIHSMLHTPRHTSLDNGLERQELAESVLKIIADPFSAHQSDRRTCSPIASVQTRMAMTDPAEYARLLEGLTSQNGVVTLASGTTLHFIEGSQFEDNPIVGDSVVTRSLESRIFQSALMQYAAGYEADASGQYLMSYDTRKDIFYDNTHGVETSGVYGNWQQRMTNDVFNEGSVRLDTSNVKGVKTHPAEVIQAIEHQLESTNIPVAVEVNWAQTGAHSEHIMLVTEVKDGRVYFSHGWRTFDARKGSDSHRAEMSEDGKLESMTIEDFQARLRSAYIADRSITAKEATLTALQEGRVYDPTNTETHNVHIDPPKASYEQQKQNSTVSLSNQNLQLDNERFAGELDQATMPDTASNLAGAASAALARGSRVRDDDDLFK
jgi:hypothetical protein